MFFNTATPLNEGPPTEEINNGLIYSEIYKLLYLTRSINIYGVPVNYVSLNWYFNDKLILSIM